MDKLFEPIRYLKGIGPQREKQLNKLGISDVFDLLWHVPRTYIDRSKTVRIRDMDIGTALSICGTVQVVRESKTRRGFGLIKAVITDGSGSISAVWFNQGFLKNVLKPGVQIFLSGKVSQNYSTPEFLVSEYEILDADDNNENLGLTPVYPSTEGVSQKIWRQVQKNCLNNYAQMYPDIISQDLLNNKKWPTGQDAFRNIHFPDNWAQIENARRRLSFEELLLMQLAIRKEKAALASPEIKGVIHKDHTSLVKDIVNGLSFSLTEAQRRVIQQIFEDMESVRPMNRLVQGDVGAGKTVVAAIAMAKAIASGYQASLMAPTEILANQHYHTLQQIFQGRAEIQLVTGKTNAKLKGSILEASARGEVDILVGTHALIQEGVAFDKLSLAIIDEQHRFGVKQRATLAKKGLWPDVMVMTATPIPRTLALTVYGDLDISTIDELPPGRKPIKTLFLNESGRGKAYKFVKDQIIKGRQCYIICPLVEESEKQDLINATDLYDKLQQTIFKDHKVGLLHGRMKSQEKNQVMEDFKAGKIQVLVSTTVVEVGVDVPNATVMLVEEAERFGLSQLHQLRGRVGRGQEQSYCILIADPHTPEGFQRLKVMERTNDGFEIANEDLRLRGPGDL
ncbi:MAG: ATP-dependent DNA helicase RecG, partial [Ignavibacteriales bacterium]